MGSAVFSECSSLESLTLEDGIEALGLNTFFNCSSLRSVRVPASVTMLDVGVFSSCTGLKELILPATLNTIEEAALEECSALEVVRFEGTTREWQRVEKSRYGWHGGSGRFTVECKDGSVKGI